jgi:hypothetical protein
MLKTSQQDVTMQGSTIATSSMVNVCLAQQPTIYLVVVVCLIVSRQETNSTCVEAPNEPRLFNVWCKPLTRIAIKFFKALKILPLLAFLQFKPADNKKSNTHVISRKSAVTQITTWQRK